MLIENWPISRLIPYSNNPRKNGPAIDAVAKSIAEFGFRQPIVVDSSGVIVVGHSRYYASIKLGLTEVPVHVASDLNESQLKALRIADNKTHELAEWDLDKLLLEVSDLGDAIYDTSVLGFTATELNAILQHEPIVEAESPAPVKVPKDPNDAPPLSSVSRVASGDIWELGQHRLMCGDSTSRDDVRLLCDGQPVDLMLTDPPYNVGYVGKTADALTIQNDKMSSDSYREFLVKFLIASTSMLKPGAAWYIWHADTFGGDVRNACQAMDLPVRQCLIWVKSTFAMGRQDYHWQHEPCVYGWMPGSHNWYSDRRQTTVFNFDKPSKSTDHPTMKPVELFERIILNSSPDFGSVLDVFGGSGTTAIACERLQRRGRLMELDPHYCEVIIRRWESYTGSVARKVHSKA